MHVPLKSDVPVQDSILLFIASGEEQVDLVALLPKGRSFDTVSMMKIEPEGVRANVDAVSFIDTNKDAIKDIVVIAS